jgi:hypothetical protein
MDRRIWTILTVVAALAGCASDPGGPDGVADQSDGRITITNDEDRLSDRIIITDDDVTVSGGAGKGTVATAFFLKLVAQVNPPTVNGQKLQATSVDLKGNFAYVSYMMRGNPAIGAIDVVQVKGVSNAVLRSSATFTDTDVIGLTYDSGNVYAAEATSNPAFDVPAVIERISTSGGSKLDLARNFRRMLTSYAATSVTTLDGAVYVTTGNTGGLYQIAQSDSLPVTRFVALDDARWVDHDGSNIVVAQGTPGRLAVFNPGTLAPVRTITFPGAATPESKSTVRLIGGKALVAAGEGGVKLIDLATGTIVGSIACPTVAGLDPSVTVTNAVDATGPYVFVSNGEAGIYLALATRDLETLTGQTPITLLTLGKLQFSSQQSVNHVAFDGSTLAIACGLGGVRFVTMGF